MKHKILKTVLASVLLAGVASMTSVSVDAATQQNYMQTFVQKAKKVVVTKKTIFNRYDTKKKQLLKAKKIVKAGQKITLTYNQNLNGWTLPAKLNARYYWLNQKADDQWFKQVKTKKVFKVGFNNRTYTDQNGSKLIINGLERLSVFNSDNDTKKPNETDLVLVAHFLNKGKKTTAKEWIADNLNVYPVNSSINHALIDDSEGRILSQDDHYGKLIDARDKSLSKNHGTNFLMVLSGNKKDINADSYVIADQEGNKITLPVQTATANVDVDLF